MYHFSTISYTFIISIASYVIIEIIHWIYWFVIPLIMYCPFTLLNILISEARIHMLILIELLLNHNLIRVLTNNTLHADELKCIWLKRFFCHFPCHSLYFVTWQIMHLLRMVMKYRFNWLHWFFCSFWCLLAAFKFGRCISLNIIYFIVESILQYTWIAVKNRQHRMRVI